MKRIPDLVALFLILAVGLTACGGNSASAKEIGGAAGDPIAGRSLFETTCVVCHGPDGQGLPNLGKNLRHSEFVTSQSDQELAQFIKVGRGPDDPLNTTGVTMPPKGGNAALNDTDLANIVAYIRTLQK